MSTLASDAGEARRCPQPPSAATIERLTWDGPIRCECCGKVLQLVCPGAVTVEMLAAVRAGQPYVPASVDALPRPVSTRKVPAYASRVCACGRRFTPRGGNDKRCDDCKAGGRKWGA